MDQQLEIIKVSDNQGLSTIFEGVCKAALQKKSMTPMTPFEFNLKNSTDNVLGGITGTVLYGALYIDMLWVDELLRNQDYGTKLMLHAEEHGIANNCTFSTVNTMDWEGLSFYQKLNYNIEFVRYGFEKDSCMYFLRKSL